MDHGVGGGQAARHRGEGLAQPAVAVAGRAVDLPQPSLGDGLGGAPLLGARVPDEEPRVESRGEVDDLLPPKDAAQALGQLLQVADQGLDVPPVLILLGRPHPAREHGEDSREGGLRDHLGAVLDPRQGQVGHRQVRGQPEGIADPRDVGRPEGGHRVGEERAILGEVGHDPDALVHVSPERTNRAAARWARFNPPGSVKDLSNRRRKRRRAADASLMASWSSAEVVST